MNFDHVGKHTSACFKLQHLKDGLDNERCIDSRELMTSLIAKRVLRLESPSLLFDVVTNQKFDMIIMIFIGLNMLTMTMDHYQMSQSWDNFLSVVNSIFVAIFTCECFLKMFSLRHHYFTEPWNLFDLVVVFLSIAGMLLSDLIEKYFVSPTLLRVVRVAKVGRVLRLVKGAKGIRTLLFALAMSLPALFNICLLLFLVMFIFSIFGMSFFMNVKLRAGLTDVYNFQTFGQSIILLFQMSTSAGWAEVLDGIINEEECDDPEPEFGKAGDCGNTTVGIAFLLAYLVMSFLIIINMYIAVILENYSQATEEVQEGLTDDDYDMYYEIWAQFDPDIHKPNKYKIISMDIPICKGDMMYCVDILDALTKDFFARKGSPIEEAVEINEVQVALDRPGYEPVSSTLWRQREEYCARLIQNAWRKHKTQQAGGSQPLEEQDAGKKDEETEENLTSSVVVDEEGGHKVVIQNSHSKSPSIASHITDV
ncbi:Sodium channel protein para [Orchesella cincta]|uniref:Sodium channel protein n=1 Tax=Orchesella cincta TaxID=48709 RepID=A0A1D2MEX0_ORCCI|nr:Sodium channel protein para [Orchesella cincta]